MAANNVGNWLAMPIQLFPFQQQAIEDLRSAPRAAVGGFGLAIKCDTCGEECPTRPIAEGDRLICLGCAATASVDKAMKLAEKSISPQKMKKLLRKEKNKTKVPTALPDTSNIRLMNGN